MLQAPIVVVQHHWADQPRGPHDAAMREIFLSDAGHSLGRYWRECTFGMIDPQTGGQIFPITPLGLTHDTFFDKHGDLQSHRTRDEVVATAIAQAPGLVAGYHPKIVFMFDNPSPAGATDHVLGAFAVLDFGGSHTFMAHEIGHTLGFDHSFGGEVEYGDPYCIMSARTFGNTSPTHARPRPAGSAVPETVFPQDMRFWDEFGPMPAAATLFHTLPEFAASSMVIRVGLEQPIVLDALSEATPGQPVIAVCEVDGIVWTAELRVATNWDAGLDRPGGPGSGVVLHGILPTPRPGQPKLPSYQGRIPLYSPKGIIDVQPGYTQPSGVAANVRLVIEDYQLTTHTAKIRFTRRQPRAVRLQLDHQTPGRVVTATGRASFPVLPCGSRELDYQRVEQNELVVATAYLSGGYIDPDFTWRINDVMVQPSGQPTVITASTVIEDTPQPAPPADRQVTVVTVQEGEGRRLRISNTPGDGTYEIRIEVSCSEPSSAGVTTAHADATDRFTGVHLDVPGLAQAIADCRKRLRARSLIDDSANLRATDVRAAVQAGTDGVRLYMELAGISDFTALATLSPNEDWPALGGGLYMLAYAQWDATDRADAVTSMRHRVSLYERLANTDPSAYRPSLAQALVDECSFRRIEDIPAPQRAGERAVTILQELAGITDYDDLDDLTPNPHWNSLAGALYMLAYAQWDATDRADAVTSMRHRVSLYERLANTDPSAYRPSLAQALVDECSFRRIEDIPAPQQAGERAVTILQELAGITDYDNLDDLTPNPHWDSLAGALYMLAYAHSDAASHAAAGLAMHQRVKIYERRTELDPGTYAPLLTAAQADEKAFSA
ncbi:hypothetical protein J5X84_28355 [Streptosporangiaceae bacterium NEAU-GS5]|nr:hypothetical protein [Streptosporangiaceae bacterium NEAU-GS5]